MVTGFSRHLCVGVVGLSSAFGTACSTIPDGSGEKAFRIGSSTENTSLFENQGDLEERANLLAPKMSEQEAFETVGISKERFTLLDVEDTLSALVGNVVPNPRTAADIREIEVMINSTKVYRLNYRDIERYGQVDWALNAQTTNTGFDRTLTLVFQDDTLKIARLTGSPSLSFTEEDNIIWEGLDGALDRGLRVLVP